MARGSVEKRGDSWTIRYDLPPAPDGERRQKRETFNTKREAEKALTKRLAEINEGEYINPSDMSFADFLDDWIQSHSQNLKDTTVSQYRQHIRNHIKPGLGKLKISNIEPLHLQRFYQQKLTSGRKDGREGGLSKRTVEYLHSIINKALDYAVKWQIIKKNPAKVVDPPRPEHKEMSYWDSDEVEKFLDHIKSDRLYSLYHLALTTGMRQGELLGLQWEDVDFEEGTVQVRQVLSRTNDGNISLSSPKTPSSRRTIGISDSVVSTLRRHRIRQNEEKLKVPEYIDNGLVFASEVGTAIRPRNLLRNFKRLTREAGLSEIRFHDLRHTHATMMLKSGVRAEIIAKRHGHRDVSTTINTYTHVTADLQKDAAEALERQIGGKHNGS